MSAGPSSSSAHHNPPTVPDDDPALCLQRLTLDDPRRAAPSKPATRMPAAMPSAMDTTAGKRCTIVPHTTRLVPPSISILRGSSLPLPWPLSRIGSVPVARGPVRAADPAKNAKNPKRLSAYFAHVRWGTASATEISQDSESAQLPYASLFTSRSPIANRHALFSDQIPSHPHSSSSTHTNTKYAAPPPTTQRPSLPSRTTSYSKRHASFDSPREVPLPSPATLMQQYFPAFPSAPRREHSKSVSQPHTQAFASVFRDEGDGSDSTSSGSSSASGSASASGSPAPSELSLRHPKVPGSPRTRHAPYPPPHLHPHLHHGDDLLRGDIKGKERERERRGESVERETQAGQVFPFARPYSLPHAHSTASSSASSASTEVGAAVGGGGSTSTSSLPLPAQTPVRLLPPASPMHTDFPLPALPLPEPPSPSSSPTSPAAAQEPPLHLRPQTQPPPPGPPRRTRDAAVPSSFTIPPLPTRRPPSPPPSHPHPHASMSRSLSTTTTESENEYASGPAPPTVLPGPARPAAPFLAPSPVEHAVRVETARGAYTLHISLPGFRRDAITLATRRRRVLHVVADDWAPGGGHFERRVSFGWDAELGAVRAEFDGSVLRVVVPRRVPGVAW
ncbi:hypothetical protein HWV62_43628 [Athelia sp. TMB]|nr:hypothetical protein HWV62_43628 [Athelia sp. TMB]